MLKTLVKQVATRLLITPVFLLVLSIPNVIAEENSKRTYYFVGAFLAHPYVRDIKLGFKYATKKLNVNIVMLGPQGPDWDAQYKAMEVAIAANPDGIIVPLWVDNTLPLIVEARKKGIEVIAIEAAPENHNANTYIGLDNYQAGLLTAQELVRIGGNKGKLGLVLNQASNTVLKRQGVIDGLKNTEWEIVAEVDDETNTDQASQVTMKLLREHPHLSGLIGLNSSSGVGIGNAIGQLGLMDKDLSIVVHDREDTVLEFIESGVIDSSIVAKTAMMSYLSIALLEDYHDRLGDDIPVASNISSIGITLLPEVVHIGAVVVNKENITHFLRKNLINGWKAE
ncbi:sugar ABC transporter substrate-binding protein [Vibrio sp. S9_S30]|uniref:substrate-binding domain-containing protein n=1 Tax=Vibrio sp. S9_S30 TaxID=2720226 RepID=UPI00168103F8|nr:substrate-binding domain-containing protein [Vibrio sp. S9_S30]MBD1556486.1 sugar ABC transporter substrate-binding protein [Vibrio sp. S9_S30]